ncbi:hypothetical protein EJ04DRAFT_276454 [Polyplosphaeria fusca]|uniref:Uncharacterized protein n=1 Tax=Polyplosphaeria fusca TaxID=682080 RepID=A0A9P4UYG1_9PLEO|nr:hypothetical protein EJ04DRAFT_276454 [Polyplosphaeria fusca]
MVLQDADDPSRDGFGQDDVADPSRPSTSRNLDFSQFRQPIPCLPEFRAAHIRYNTEKSIRDTERTMGRSMTAEEVHAYASRMYNAQSTQASFTAFCLTIGIGRWLNTMKTNAYPFIDPKPEALNQNKFLFFTGRRARIARHSWRLTLYLLVARAFGVVAGAAIGTARARRSTANDPHLTQIDRELSEARRAAAEKRVQDWAGRIQRENEARGVHKPRERPSAPVAPSNGEDDMSPTASVDPWAQATTDSWDDQGHSTESQQASNSSPSQSRYDRTRVARGERTDDDMSSTGGLFQGETTHTQPTPGESAWDRLRRGVKPSPTQQPVPRIDNHRKDRKEGSSFGDDYTFAGPDRDKAQREFDERIERERQGKDFSDEKRW